MGDRDKIWRNEFLIFFSSEGDVYLTERANNTTVPISDPIVISSKISWIHLAAPKIYKIISSIIARKKNAKLKTEREIEILRIILP